MTESEDTSPTPSSSDRPPRPQVRSPRRARISWIWLVPLIAAIVGASMLFRDWLHAGPTVTISFDTAEGLEVGRTTVRYKDVNIGIVSNIKVSSDRKKALVKVDVNRDAASYVTQPGTRFWVVRPRLGISGVTGLNTLLSGAYISVDAPEKPDPDAEPVYEFKGLETPPEISSTRPGTRFTLVAPDLGSLEIGSPVYYRKIQVGQVVGYALDKSGNSVNVQVFIDAPNDKFVTRNARFWNASGINLSLSAEGFNVQTGSLVSVVAGGVAFAQAGLGSTEPAEPNARFPLANTREEAMADPDGPPFDLEMHFTQSVRGLKVGAPVDFRGMELGNVTGIEIDYDRDNQTFFARVRTRLYPLRLGRLYREMVEVGKNRDVAGERLLANMVKHGLRGQMRPSNLLTGQQYVALDFFPKAEPVTIDIDQSPIVLPTIAGSFDRLQQQISSIVGKLEGVPFDDIGKELRNSLNALNGLLRTMDGTLAPQATAMLKSAQKSLDSVNRTLSDDSSLSGNLQQTMRELSRAAKSLRDLADYLQAHPASLVRGTAKDPEFITP
ncbi:MCE family protein [Allopusillimonas soli]|uniref:MCE family protein n=1 Tax=Allopusillimonas soli TaxID=659016 RepID=A0A853FEX7_9BURK|nr:MlaD family protein [Allopusillimonas soli]NYT37061.1 MCE family protein [Allopusillimonas soli]TEA75500.1 MCE family protein [Allopusillimonas soli]